MTYWRAPYPEVLIFCGNIGRMVAAAILLGASPVALLGANSGANFFQWSEIAAA